MKDGITDPDVVSCAQIKNQKSVIKIIMSTIY